VTSAAKGLWLSDDAARREILDLMGLTRRGVIDNA